jgi:hypothetical protein
MVRMTSGVLTVSLPHGLVRRIIDGRDTPRSDLVHGQLRGRNLPVACAVFAEQLTRTLEEMKRR